MTDIYALPDDLPVPVDDGACDHLIGLRLNHSRWRDQSCALSDFS